MARLFIFILMILLFVPASAQDRPPDYRINIIRGAVAADGQNVEVEFGISNIGGTATETAQVQLVAVNVSGIEVVDTRPVRPLSGNSDREIFTLSIPITRFPPGEQQQFRIQLAPTSISSIPQSFTVSIPLYTPTGSFLERLLPQIDFQDQRQVMLVAAIMAVGTIILWLLTVLLRQLFKKPPQFGTWQPPYATLAPLDVNSTLGRRQLWQQYAQNNIITTPCTPTALHGTKLLIGTDGKYLSGWHITSIRLSQYDMYGRVSRTVVLAPNSVVNRLDRAAQRSGTVERTRLQRQMRPLARKLAKLILKRITARSAMLPMALDVRFQGIHGEVSIMFSVYQCNNSTWQQMESWYPDMMVVSKTIYESYTYTLFGQSGGESLKEFRRRLPDDITHVLTELIGARPFMPEKSMAAPVQRESPPTNPNMTAVDLPKQTGV